MNALKNILFFGLLIAVLCGVYFSLSRQPEATLPEELTSQATPPKVEVPGIDGSPAASIPGNPAANNLAASNSAASSPAPGTQAASGSGGIAPAFQPQSPRESTSAPHFPSVPQGGVADSNTALPPPPGGTPPGSGSNKPGDYSVGARDPFDAAGRSGNAGLPDRDMPPSRYAASSPETTRVSLPTDEHSQPASVDTILHQVELKMRENNLAAALELLSPLQDNSDVPAYQAQKITEILDYMAAKVIYSREHLLDDVYRVKPGDTLDKIADHYQVPALLLSRINGVDIKKELPTGKELKVLKGPFSAYVSTGRSELKMMLSGRYAGRFTMSLSGDLLNVGGIYHVVAKSALDANGSPTRPQWIELDNSSSKIGIQGTADLRAAAGSGRSTIWLSEQDMDDVFGILSVGSAVIIQK